MKKLLLSLGAVAAVAAPVAAVVACSNDGAAKVTPAQQTAASTKVSEAGLTSAQTLAATEAIAKAKTNVDLSNAMADVVEESQNAKDEATLTKFATDKRVASADVNALKESTTTKIGENALSAIALIADDATNKLVSINEIIEEFVESAGAKLLFNQAKQQKVFTFAADGKLTWSQVDANPAITYDNVAAFEHRHPAFHNVYETAQNKVLEAAEALLKA